MHYSNLVLDSLTFEEIQQLDSKPLKKNLTKLRYIMALIAFWSNAICWLRVKMWS